MAQFPSHCSMDNKVSDQNDVCEVMHSNTNQVGAFIDFVKEKIAAASQVWYGKVSFNSTVFFHF